MNIGISSWMYHILTSRMVTSEVLGSLVVRLVVTEVNRNGELSHHYNGCLYTWWGLVLNYCHMVSWWIGDSSEVPLSELTENTLLVKWACSNSCSFQRSTFLIQVGEQDNLAVFQKNWDKSVIWENHPHDIKLSTYQGAKSMFSSVYQNVRLC